MANYGASVKRSRSRGRRPTHSGGSSNGNSSGGGGNGNNGGGYNPNRSYDSSGPEIKIRGSATHVYEKYLQLARDANSGGDRVMAENYLQHAEHYYRIMAAQQAQAAQYQAQQAAQRAQQGGNNNGQQQPAAQDQANQAQPAQSAPSFSLAEGEQEDEGEEADAN